MNRGDRDAGRFFRNGLLQYRDLLMDIALGGAAVFHGDVQRLGGVFEAFQPAFPIVDAHLKRHHHVFLVDGTTEAPGIPFVVQMHLGAVIEHV